MKKILAAILVFICVFSLAGCVDDQNAGEEKRDTGYMSYHIAVAEYPVMAPYPNEMAFVDEKTGIFDDEAFSFVYDAWHDDILAQRQQEGYERGLERFFSESTKTFLSDSNSENKVYSPLNVYMALAMLAEVTDNNSRQQILDLLGSADIESLRTQATTLWNAHYRDDGAVTSILAGSLWLNKDISFIPSTMESLAKYYYASSFSGEMGSEAFNTALQDWLNDQTGGLLKEQASGITMSPETIMALATTIYYKSKWHNVFSESKTEKGLFNLADAGGTAVECDFMRKSDTNTYYWGEKFSAVAQGLEAGGAMWFILPDDNTAADALLGDEETVSFILQNHDWANNKTLVVNLAVPKFDVGSDINLSEGLKTLGITDVFSPKDSDFSPMTTDTDDIYLSAAQHAARVKIDEEGCTAAAYTVMMAAGTAMPPDDEVDFVLDRPFIFAITGADGLPMFVGIVNNPA
ncbi:MAG: serpin family protein [Clostridiales bacterium]|nr:serpin family protein [Clostridiales bacterium]